ncbi:MAG: LD-carboxypeptidase [Bacteroidales bacterium]|nr:LD-carboxypeptidase [Bacteroidales bacterium]
MHTKPIRPPDLKPGDKIGIVAPARKVSREEMAPAIAILGQWGYETVEGQHLYGDYYQFSGNDEERATDFQAMLDDDSVKAIFCARGGYGSVRIIDRLDFTRFQEKPKWIVGYSDITVFHSHIYRHFGIQTLHAAMPINFPHELDMNISLQSLKDVLEGGFPEYHFSSHPFNRSGKATGILCGGNLSLLYSLSGTISDINTEGKVLFIEDLDEYLYHIDRMMMNLKRSGRLESLAGLVVGGMNDMNDNAVPFGKTVYEIIVEAVSDYHFPVIFNFKSGHISENLGLIIGGHVHLVAAEQCSLVFND